ncbi:MAG: helix-hairpin-helix domain-containing protein [Acidobacteriaceae bacterium]
MNDQRHRSLLAVAAILGMTVFTACNPPANDQHLQEQAAQATEQAKQGSKRALADARVVAKNAEQAVNDVAAGVRQGIDNKNDSSPRVNLNSASSADLEALPGISPHKAQQIVDHRPYASSHDLVKDRLLTEAQFAQIAPKVTVAR